MDDPAPYDDLPPNPDMETLRREWRQWDEEWRTFEVEWAALQTQARVELELLKREEALMARRPFWPF